MAKRLQLSEKISLEHLEQRSTPLYSTHTQCVSHTQLVDAMNGSKELIGWECKVHMKIERNLYENCMQQVKAGHLEWRTKSNKKKSLREIKLTCNNMLTI